MLTRGFMVEKGWFSTNRYLAFFSSPVIRGHLGVLVMGYMSLFRRCSGAVLVPDIDFPGPVVPYNVSVVILLFAHGFFLSIRVIARLSS